MADVIEILTTETEVVEVVTQGPQGIPGTGGSGGDVAWDDITDKPLEFAPEAHASTHATAGSDPLAPGDIGLGDEDSPTFTGLTLSGQAGNGPRLVAISDDGELANTTNYFTDEGKSFVRGDLGAAASTTATAAVYVSKIGLDAADGLAPDRSKLTIGSALTVAATLLTAGAPSVRVEVQDGGTYTEDITVPANVQVRAMAARLDGTVSISAGGECLLGRHFATSNNQNMLTMGDAASGPAIYSAHVMDGRGASGSLTGVQNVRNIGGGGKNLFLRVGILFVGESGIGIGDTTAGFGHIHIEIEDLYLAGSNGIGIQAGASGGPNVANMVGVVHHILEFGSPNDCTGIVVNNASAVVKLLCAEITSQIAYNVSAGTLWLTCPRVTGTRTLSGSGVVTQSVQTTGVGPVSIDATSNTLVTIRVVGSDNVTRSVAFPLS
jgi:hypothetical protein